MAKECTVCGTVSHSAANFCSNCREELPDKELSVEDQLRIELNNAKKTIQGLNKAIDEKDTKPPVIIVEPQPVQPQPPVTVIEPTITKTETKPFPWAILVVGLALLLVIGGAIGYYSFYVPYAKEKEIQAYDRDAPRYYTFSGENTFLRSSAVSGVDHNILARLPYGSELIFYGQGGDWTEVKWISNQENRAIKGFVFSSFLLNNNDFDVLNNIWGDRDSREIITQARQRRALINYFKDNNLTDWKVYSKNKDAKRNTSFFRKIVNPDSKHNDFAVIIRNDITNERRFLLFSFDDHDETPRLQNVQWAPPTGDIVSVVRIINTYDVTYSQ